MGDQVTGIDVSFWQGVVNWVITMLMARFAYIRASGGTIDDPQFARNWSETARLNIVRGAYHFFYVWVDPRAQAAHFAGLVGTWDEKGNYHYGGQLPPMVDVEDGSLPLWAILVWWGQLPGRLKEFVDEFYYLTGLRVGIYTRKTWWDRWMPKGLAWAYPLMLWVAQYGPPPPWIPAGWSGWKFWQYSADGNGLGRQYGMQSAAVDIDRYNGTLDEFNKEFNVSVETVPKIAVPKEVVVTAATLNLRNQADANSAASIIGTTFKGTHWFPSGYVLDGQGRVWYQVCPNVYLAAWLVATVPA